MKKIGSALIVIWLLGALVMAGYYEFERKSSCIRDEGFWKGWLWCSNDPKLDLAWLIQRTVFLVKGLAWPIMIFVREDKVKEANGPYFWEIRGDEAVIVMESKANTGESQLAVLIIKYKKQAQCRAEVAVLRMVGKKLGPPTRQEKSSQFLLVRLGDSQPVEYPAFRNEYTNGIAGVAILDTDTLSKMEKEQFVTVGLKGEADHLKFPLLRFQKINDEAKSLCSKP